MHILLTDVLCCPRCGPDHGLIVLADRLEERRVLEGRLGCPNCRGSYAVRGGVAELGTPAAAGGGGAAPPPEGVGTAPVAPDDVDAPVRIAALLDLAGGATLALLAGGAAAHAAEVARLVPDVEVVALDPPGAPPPGVSVVRSGAAALPFRSLSLRAVALGAGAAAAPAEGLRVLAVGGRLLLEAMAPAARAELEAAGARLLLDQEGVAVASRERHV